MMASVSGVTSSNSSSLYGTRNVLSGLASGMDTESMIENSVSGIRLKMTGITQKQTKLQWKQEAFQSVTDKLVQFSRKYTSYTSATNLLSASFFNKAVTVSTNGANASSASASGRTSSEVQLNGVAQLATSSRYQSSSSAVLSSVLQGPDGSRSIQAASAIDLSGETFVSNLSGTMSLKYGSQSISLSFDESEVYETSLDYLNAIRNKLSQQTISFSNGTTTAASNVIGLSLIDGNIQFSDLKDSGNDLYINSVSGRLSETFSDTTFGSETKLSTLPLSGKELKRSVDVVELISGKKIAFNLDGTSKTITPPTESELSTYMTEHGNTQTEAFSILLQTKLNDAFGSGRITVGNASADPSKLQLNFTVAAGSSLSVTSDANAALGLSKSESTALDTTKTLGALLGSNLGGLTGGVLLNAVGSVTKQSDGSYLDSEGNKVNASGERLGADGELLYGFELKINDKTIGTYTRDTSLETVLVGINSNTEAGVSVSYSKTTNQFVFNSKQSGSGHGVSFAGGLAESIFGTYQESNYTAGKDAIVNMTVNGSNLTVTRSSNTFDVDGLSLTVKNTFNGSMDATGDPVFDFLDVDGKVDATLLKDPVTFSTSANADTIVSAIKSMVEDYNTIMTELKSAFSTLPAQKSDNSRYEPLTEEDKEGMSDTAIKNYEEKAKQGLLFGDSDLSSLYGKLLSAIAPSGSDGTALRSMGISTDYYQGLTTLSLDETKLRDMLSTNPDSVRDAFTKIAGSGSSTNGLMQNLKTPLNTYAAVEGTKGILINKAGSKYSAASLLKNSIQDQLDSYETQVDKLGDQLSTKVDYYTRQYTRLEQLISQMNSQSSAIAGLTG